MFIKKVILSTTIILCLGFISCKETNGPMVPPEEIEIFFEGPIVINSEANSFSGSGYTNPDAYSISDILIMSDIIFVGKVSKIDTVLYSVNIEITDLLKGATNEKIITLRGSTVERRVSGGLLNVDDVSIYFIRKEGDVFVFSTKGRTAESLSIMYVELLGSSGPYYETVDDMKLLCNAYKKNKELFSKAGKQDLINLYPQFTSNHIKWRFLLSFKIVFYRLLDKQDIPMLLEWKQMVETDISDKYPLYRLDVLKEINELIRLAGG
jgi:hypothetical protein